MTVDASIVTHAGKLQSVAGAALKLLRKPTAELRNVSLRYLDGVLRLEFDLRLERPGFRKKISSVEIKTNVQKVVVHEYQLESELDDDPLDKSILIEDILRHVFPDVCEYWSRRMPKRNEWSEVKCACRIPVAVAEVVESRAQQIVDGRRSIEYTNLWSFPVKNATFVIDFPRPIRSISVIRDGRDVAKDMRLVLNRSFYIGGVLGDLMVICGDKLHIEEEHVSKMVVERALNVSVTTVTVSLSFEANEKITIILEHED